MPIIFLQKTEKLQKLHNVSSNSLRFLWHVSSNSLQKLLTAQILQNLHCLYYYIIGLNKARKPNALPDCIDFLLTYRHFY